MPEPPDPSTPAEDSIRPRVALLGLGLFGGALLALIYFLGGAFGPPSPGERAQFDAEEPEDWRSSGGQQGRIRTRGAADAGVSGRGVAPVLSLQNDDPQVVAHRRSFRNGDAGVPMEFPPSRHMGRVVSSSGDSPVSTGDACFVRLLPVMGGSFNCVVTVACAERVIYPDSGQENGYAPCDVEAGQVLRALDEGITSADGDPTLEVDVRRGTVVVSDGPPRGRSFSTTIRI